MRLAISLSLLNAATPPAVCQVMTESCEGARKRRNCCCFMILVDRERPYRLFLYCWTSKLSWGLILTCHCLQLNESKLAGDSRAVLCRNGQAIPLTDDHKAAREDETVSFLTSLFFQSLNNSISLFEGWLRTLISPLNLKEYHLSCRLVWKQQEAIYCIGMVSG